MTKKLHQDREQEMKNKNIQEPKFEMGTPINSFAKIKRLFLDTTIGGPIDTPLEVKAQTNNLGPKNTRLEIALSNKTINNKTANKEAVNKKIESNKIANNEIAFEEAQYEEEAANSAESNVKPSQKKERSLAFKHLTQPRPGR